MNQWWKPSDAKDIKKRPWLNDAAVDYFEKSLSPEFLVLEHGAGGSTLWLSERVKAVESYDDDVDWIREVKAQAGDNIKVYSSDTIRFDIMRDFDIVFIDGEPVEDRCQWIIHAPLMVKPGGLIILDNANRPEYITEREGLKQYATLEYTANGNEGATRYLLTEFWRTHATRQQSTQEVESADVEAGGFSGDSASAEFLGLSRKAVQRSKKLHKYDDAKREHEFQPLGVG